MDAAPVATSPPHARRRGRARAGGHRRGGRRLRRLVRDRPRRPARGRRQSDAQASSGLLVLSIGMGVCGAGAELPLQDAAEHRVVDAGRRAAGRPPGHVSGGYPAALGAFLLAGALVVLAGLSERVTKAIISIPGPLASGLLGRASCSRSASQPARALVDVPGHAAPVVATWLVLWVFARRWAIIGALAVLALTVIDRPRGRPPPRPRAAAADADRADVPPRDAARPRRPAVPGDDGVAERRRASRSWPPTATPRRSGPRWWRRARAR